jgi:hypothetical protein
MATTDAVKVRVMGLCGAWMFLVAMVLGIVATSSSHWSVSGDADWASFHMGPWKACAFAAGSDTCVVLDGSSSLVSSGRYHRIQAVRGMMIVGAILATAGLATGLATVLPRYPTDRLVAVPLVTGVIAAVLGIIATIMWSDIQSEGFGKVLGLRYGWGFDTAVAFAIFSFLASVPYMVAAPFAFAEVKTRTAASRRADFMAIPSP